MNSGIVKVDSAQRESNQLVLETEGDSKDGVQIESSASLPKSSRDVIKDKNDLKQIPKVSKSIDDNYSDNE